MQKKLIALAIAAGMSGAAFAQSNVTIYGVADMYFGAASADGKKSTNVINSGGLAGSRLGFKGVEDLGNGTKALFVLEYGLGMDQNSAFLDGSGNAARQQLVGLTGDWGTAVAGYAQTAGYDWACSTGPIAGSALDPNAKVGGSLLLTCGKNGRSGNAVAYISPSMGGFTVAVNHARVTETAYVTNADDNTANLLSGTYANGPIKASLVWSKIYGHTGATFVNDITEVGVDGSYNFGAATLFASWQSHDTANTGEGKDTKWNLAVAVPVGAGTIVAQYAKSTLKDDAVVDNGGKAWTLAYAHGLSKRTTLYTGYTRVTNETNGTNAAVIAPNAGGASSVFAAGINHKF